MSKIKLLERTLGKTGLTVSVLGLGGFHQVEVMQSTLNHLITRYLEAGGNYIETARGYGKGASEYKLGKALEGRRDQVILASKCGKPDEEKAWVDINESLEQLRTSHIDVHFFHGIRTMEKLDAITSSEGALKAFERAKDQGMIRHIGMSSHWPPLYVETMRRLPIEVVLIWGNYLDFCNYPEIPNEVIPALREKGIGILFMKPLADGFLYRSPRMALRYALAQDVDCLVAGFNSMEMLETDIEICADVSPVTDEELEAILREAPELGDYVCRQCAECPVCEDSTMLKKVFELEGKVDRQMDDRRTPDAAHYALRERLKGWFNNEEQAQEHYRQMREPALRLMKGTFSPCVYSIDIPRKLQLAHAKLSDSESLEIL